MSRAEDFQHPVRVLTIEPVDGASHGIGDQLTPIGDGDLTVQTVSNVETAHERVTAEHIDCVVCLHDPPAVDGIDVLTALRDQHPRLPILFATETDAEEIIQHGPTDVVELSDGKLNPAIATNRISSMISRDRERDKYHQIFEQATDGIAVHDPDSGEILDANRRLYRLLRYDPETSEALSLSDIVSGTDEYTEAAARERVRKAAEDGPQTFEWLNETADGDAIWVEVSLKPATIAGGDRVLAFVRDITDRKENERLLRDREQQLEAVFDHPSSFAVVLDDEGRVLRANQPALDYVGAVPSDVEGSPLWETPWWNDDDDDAAAERVRETVEAAATGDTSRLQVEIVSGPERQILDLHVEPISRDTGEAPGVEGIVIAGYDITEREDRERKLRENRDTLQRLHEITAKPDVSLEEQVEQLLEFGADRFDMDIAFLSRIDEAAGDFEIIDARGDHELIQAGNESALSETYCRHTISSETDDPLTVENAAETMGDDPAYERFGLGCYLGDKIVVDGDLYGTLCFADDDIRDRSFTGEETTLLDIMAQWLEQELTQREYQTELEEAQSRLEQTLERIDDAFFAVDDDWRITYVNEAGVDVLRRATDADSDAEALVGRHLWEAIPDVVETTFSEQYHEAMETQESVSFEEYYDPLNVWFEVQAYPDEGGLSVYFTDITERKEREQELKTKTEAMETAPVGIILTDPDQDDNPIVYANERFEEMTGYTEDEVVGRNCRLLQGDDTDPDAVAEMREAVDDQRSGSVELRNYRQDGTEFWNDVTIAPVKDESGTVTNWIGFQQDITERKERERELVRLQELLEQTERIADVGGWEIDTDTMEVFWSEHLFELLGVDGDEEPPLDEALDVYLEEDRPVVEAGVDAALDSEEPFDVEVRYRRTEDTIRWLRVQGVPIVDDGDVVTIRGAAQDITERKEREQTLNDLLDATQSLIRASDEAELVDAIVAGVNTVFDYEISSVRLHDAEAGTLSPTRISSEAEELVSVHPTYDDRESLFGEVFQSGEATIVDDLSAAADNEYGPIGSAMLLPLDEYGVLKVGAVESAAFDEEEVALVKLFATAAVSAFDRLEQESEMRHLKRIIDHVDEKVFLLDEHGRFVYVTEPLAAYLGVDREKLGGTHLTDIVGTGDFDACEAALEDMFACDRSESLTLEVDVVTPSDEGQPVELELAPVEGTDRKAEIAGVVTDISELAKTRSSLETERERFKSLFENLPDPIVEVEFADDEPVVQYVNPAFTETFGYERETAHGSNLNDLIVPEDERESSANLDDRAIDGEQTRVDAQRKTTDGHRDFLLRGIPYAREDGTYGFAVYTDITEQKERERYLQVLNRVLRHNLRNDMNVVMALAKRLAQNVEDDELAHYARTLEDNAEDVATLSEKAKEIERVLGRRGSDTGVVDVASHLHDVISEQRDAHPDVQFSIDIPDELWIAGNENVRRACEELIENAIEHNDTDTPRVAIETRDGPEQDDWVELCFHDDGSGIPDSEWRVVGGDEEISQLSHGSGLGLWLTRWIVESYGGDIYREQRENEDGTTIVLRFRRQSPDATSDGTGQAELA